MCFDMLFAGAIHTEKQAKIDAARVTQKSKNELAGSATALQQFSASLGNKRRMEAAGSQANDIAGNTARLERSLTHATMEGRIQAAEELGAASAMAGAAGVGGASVEAYNETVRLTSAIKEQAAERAVGQQEWASEQQRGNTIKAAVAGMDNNNYRANIDYTQYLDDKKPSLFSRVVGIGMTAAATAFGGPQAGAAVAGMWTSMNDARNGDLDGASRAFSGALQNGMSAARTIHETSGGPDISTPGSASSAAGEAIWNLSNPMGGRERPSYYKFFTPQSDNGMGSIMLK